MEGESTMKKHAGLGSMTACLLAVSGLVFSGEAPQQKIPPLQVKNEQAQFRKELVKLKYIDAQDAFQLLLAYRSYAGSINIARDANKNSMLVLYDAPDVIDKMLALVKEIDIKPAELLFTVQLVLGSESGEEKTDDSLKNDPVIRDIRNFLKYKTFSLLDTTLVRTMEREDSQVRFGKNGEYSLELKPKFIKDEKEENIQTEIQLRYYFGSPNPPGGRVEGNLIRTTLTMKSGEKTVVGVSKMSDSDKGLILIISGKVVK
jgi:hypothetical protein